MNLAADSLRISILKGAVTACDVSWALAGKLIITDPFNRVYWVKSGEGFVEHHGKVHHLVPGKLFLIPAGSPGRYWCPDKMNLVWCHFTASILANTDLFGFFRCEYEIGVSACDLGMVNSLWGFILRFLESHSIPDSLAADASIRLLVSFFLDTADTSEMKGKGEVFERFSSVFRHIEDNISRPIAIPELARKAGLQENYFTNLFTKHFGVSPVRYVNLQRIRHAQRLMSGSSLPLKEIAQRSGFGNEFYFSRVFRNTVGMPPGEYRSGITRGQP